MNNNEKYVLEWFRNHVWSRPKPSTVCDGVGIFAIRDIPKGTSIYDLADKSVCAWIPWEEIQTLPKGMIDWILTIQSQIGSKVCEPNLWWSDKDGPIWLYTIAGMNWIHNWFFQNHSDNPNVDTYMTSHPRVWTHIANRDIKEGEELLENYDVCADNFIELTKNKKIIEYNLDDLIEK